MTTESAPAAGSRPGALAGWAALNQRQRHYLTAIYDADQAAERDIADRRRRRQHTPPAAQWRWLTFSIPEAPGHTSIQETLRRAGHHDPGAGSSLAALERRRLVQVRHTWAETPFGVLPVVQVKLTTLGRATARAGRDEPPRPRPPAGLLSGWLWSALAQLYAAGPAGTVYGPGNADVPAEQRGPSWNALLALRDRRDGSYMEEIAPAGRASGYRARLTDRGRQHYELHYHCYRELYPDVDAPEPAAQRGAHRGLVDHQRRPRHLLGGPDWRLLVELARLERAGRCAYREIRAKDYHRAGLPVPDHIAAIPPGLLDWQVKHITRSSAVVRRLRDRPGEPLVTVIDPRPDADPGRAGDEQVELVCLTAAGREHITTHLAEYQQLYPEIHASDLTTGGQEADPR